SIPALSVGALPLGATFIDSANGLGIFAWTPDFTQSGTYIVTFFATDDSLAVDSEVVAIIVTEAGDQRPVIAPINDTTIAEGSSVILLLSATDADDPLPPNLTFTTTIANAFFVDSGNGKGTFTYNSTFFDAGIDTVTFFATDNSVPPLTAIEVVQIITQDINLAPKLDSLGPFNVLVGDQLQFLITAIDSTDPDTSHIVALSILNAPINATFVDSGNNTGLFTFVPDLTQVGVDTISFNALDQGVPPLSSIINVIITVVADNQEPVIDTISPKSVIEGGILSFLVRAIDADGDPLTLTTRDQPNNALFIDSGNGVGLFTFTPDFLQGGGSGASELYAITFVAFDGIDDARELVYIQVYDAGNQSPEFDPITPPSVVEGNSLRFAIVASDPDGNIPTLIADSLPPGATFIDSGNGIGVISFDPTFVQAGTYEVFITASDGVLTTKIQFTITVIEAGNQAPVLAFDSLVLDFTETDSIDFKFAALDPDLNQPTYNLIGIPAGATFTDEGDSAHFIWQTLNGDNGIYDMVVFAVDSLDSLIYDSAFITINLRDSNFVPFIQVSPSGQERNVNEGDTLTYRVFAEDNDGTIPVLQTDTLHPNMTFVDSGNGVGLLTFTPDFTQGSPNPGTPYFVIFRAVDTAGGANLVHETAPQRFFVLHVDLPPVIAPFKSPDSVVEGQTLNFIVSSIDPDGDTPLMRAENVPANASAVNFGGPPNMSFTFAPNFTQAGTYFITFISAFGGLEDSAIAEIVVIEAGNQTPVWITTLADTISAVAGTPISIPMSAIDADLDLLVIAASFLPVGAILFDSGNGAATFDYNPDLGDVGSNFAIDFIVSDPLLASDTISTVFKVMAFLRGDANSDTQVDLTDVIFIVDFVFRGGMEPISLDAADANASGEVEVGDVVYLVNYMFRRGPPPPN
ncbi:MAG: hypothetical protein IIB00_07980, partial [candidate division Zixibacteria bacterium]|nr:hypothetical protein [candidate division Zixibacteria bacterium]